MIVIQGSPLRRNLVLILVAGVLLGVVLGQPLALVLGGELNPLVSAGIAVVAVAALLFGLRLAYRPLAYDPEARTVRFGRRTVPLATVTEAWRSVGVGPQSSNLIYRFRSTEGPTARVLVASMPYRGLDRAGLAVLADFVRLLPLRVEEPDAARRDALASNVVGDGTWVPVTAQTLLEELDPAPLPPSVPEPAAAPVFGQDAAAQHADDEAAAEALNALPAGARLTRRIAGVLFWLAVAVASVLLIIAVVLERSGERIDDVGPLVGVITGVLALLGAVRTIAADLDVRQRRRAAARWMAVSSEQLRSRGLPAPYAAAWLEPAPGHRSLGLAGFLLGMIGMLFGLGGLVLLFGDFDHPFGPAGPAVILVSGVLVSALAIWIWIRWRRRRRTDAQWLIEALGLRLA